MRSYSIDPNFSSKNFRVFGTNGLEIGQCWPRQIAGLRDGAHGKRVGGFSGTEKMGTYSIVVSGLYDDIDCDLGDRLYYSGPNAHSHKESAPDITSNGVKCLLKSLNTQLPVRVLRSYTGKSSFAPEAGLRYDGLYKVVEQIQRKNAKGGTYMQFKFIRLSNQDPINTFAPSSALVNQFQRVNDRYPARR
jgi:hypothetical protein